MTGAYIQHLFTYPTITKSQRQGNDPLLLRKYSIKTTMALSHLPKAVGAAPLIFLLSSFVLQYVFPHCPITRPQDSKQRFPLSGNSSSNISNL